MVEKLQYLLAKTQDNLLFIIPCQQSDVLKTVSIKLPYTVLATVASQHVNQNQSDGNHLSDSKFGVFFLMLFLFIFLLWLLTALLKPHLNVFQAPPCLRLCDRTDASFESGPARKSLFNDMFLSFHHCPLCLLSSGCLPSAELQCAPVRHNLWPAICCVPRELRFLEKSISPYLLHIRRGCFR